MKVRKDKIKEGLVKASLDNFKERIASGDTSYNDEKPRSKSKTTQKVLPNAKEILEKMGAVNTALAGKAQAVSSYTNTNEKIDTAVNKPAAKSSECLKSTSIKIVGLDSDKDDLNLALKYIIQLNPCAPLKNITVMCDRYSSFTAALVAKTDVDWIALDKGIIDANTVVSALIKTMEEYANYGFSIMEEKLREDKGYFFSNRAFLDIFLQLTDKSAKQVDEEGVEEL